MKTTLSLTHANVRY